LPAASIQSIQRLARLLHVRQQGQETLAHVLVLLVLKLGAGAVERFAKALPIEGL
jgi:hypothetical protein